MMLRVFLFTLAASLLGGCGGASDGGSATSAGSSNAPYREGTHYERLVSPIAGAADNEVVEVFSYACPGCAQFQPEIDVWKRERGDAVILRYEPAEFHPSWLPFARAYHAMRRIGALGRGHRALFEGLYRSGAQPAQTLDQIADLLAAAGIDRDAFMTAAASPEVDAALEASRNYLKLASVASTPTLIVAGRYRVERNIPGGVKATALADWLIANRP